VQNGSGRRFAVRAYERHGICDAGISGFQGEVAPMTAEIVLFVYGLAVLVLSVALLMVPFLMLGVLKRILLETETTNFLLRLHEDEEDLRQATAVKRP
jgi:hypothetical protein